MKTIKYMAMMLAMMLAGFSYVACSDDDDDDGSDGGNEQKATGTVLNQSLSGTVWRVTNEYRYDRDGNMLERDYEGEIIVLCSDGEYEDYYGGSGRWSQSGNYVTIKKDYGSGSGYETEKWEVTKYNHHQSMTVKMDCDCEYSGYGDDDYDEDCAYHVADWEYVDSEDDYYDSGYDDSGYDDSGYGDYDDSGYDY